MSKIIDLITGGHTALANCLAASVLDTAEKSYLFGNPIILFISSMLKCRLSLDRMGICAPPPEFNTVRVGSGLSMDNALTPLERNWKTQLLRSQFEAIRSSFFQ